MERVLQISFVCTLLVISVISGVYQIRVLTSALGVLPNQYNPSTSTTCSQIPGIAVLPCATTTSGPSVAVTDWAVIAVGMEPSPQFPVGTSVIFNMTMAALSSTGSFPQNVLVQCLIDGSDCGSGTITYPGPTGTYYLVTSQTPWIATAGTHTLTWQIDTTNDPNPANNVGSYTFTVSAPVFDFNVTASPTFVELQPNQTSSATNATTVHVNLVSGPTTAVSLSVLGVPGNISYALATTSGNPTFASKLTFKASSGLWLPFWKTSVMIRGIGGGLTRFTNITLMVIPPFGDFNVTTSPAVITVNWSNEVPSNPCCLVGWVYTKVFSIGSFSSPVTLSYLPPFNPPAGLSIYFLTSTVTPPPGGVAVTNTTVIMANSQVPPSFPGYYAFLVVGTSGSVKRYAFLNITVTAYTTTTSSGSGSKCFIATAAYGSELAPEVRILRTFRDESIIRTKTGSAFLIAFNSWYYSFSPVVANYLTQHPYAAAATRILLYPLIGIIFTTSRVYSLLVYYPELATLLSGIVASSLIGGFYFGLPIGIARWRIRRLRALKLQSLLERSLVGVFLVGIAMWVIGETSSNLDALIASSSIIVLSTLSLAAVICSNVVASRFEARRRRMSWM